jgi:hypothetical protein
MAVYFADLIIFPLREIKGFLYFSNEVQEVWSITPVTLNLAARWARMVR